MSTSPVVLPSLDTTVIELVQHLTARRDSALVAAPGCGSTTLTERIRAGVIRNGAEVIAFDLSSTKTLSDPVSRLTQLVPLDNAHAMVITIDHAASLVADDLKRWLEAVQQNSARLGATCLWIGPLDARAIDRDYRCQIHAAPRCHATFPLLPRHDLISAYKAIAEAHGCVWGEAILFLLVDFCGNDLALVESATEYFYGDWSTKLYDATVWDRVNEWFAHSPRIQEYRLRTKTLPEESKKYLTLLRLGGKPVCARTELREEVNDALRILCLQGILIQNLLPGFYQIRNLTIRYLLQEDFQGWDKYRPELLFRRVTNERVSQLLQDVEAMLRYVLLSVFERLGEERVQQLLKGKQGDGEFIPPALNKTILEFVEQSAGPQAKQALNTVLTEHRKAFRDSNSVWERVSRLMEEDDKNEADSSEFPKHLRSVEYLTFAELADVFVELISDVFPASATDGNLRSKLVMNWREALSKVRRLRNQVAHLRNVAFQDMEDLVGTIEGMRKDIVNYCAWR